MNVYSLFMISGLDRLYDLSNGNLDSTKRIGEYLRASTPDGESIPIYSAEAFLCDIEDMTSAIVRKVAVIEDWIKWSE